MLDDVHKWHTRHLAYSPAQVAITLSSALGSRVLEGCRTYSGDNVAFVKGHSLDEAVVGIRSAVYGEYLHSGERWYKGERTITVKTLETWVLGYPQCQSVFGPQLLQLCQNAVCDGGYALYQHFAIYPK